MSVAIAFTSVLLFGPEAGAVTLALDCPVLAWHRRMGLESWALARPIRSTEPPLPLD